jgi:hypothetical protein
LKFGFGVVAVLAEAVRDNRLQPQDLEEAEEVLEVYAVKLLTKQRLDRL